MDLGNIDEENHPPYDDVQEKDIKEDMSYISRGLRTLWRLIVEQGRRFRTSHRIYIKIESKIYNLKKA